MKRISKERAKNLISSGAILVDMRSPVAFRDGHVAGAVNLPLKNFTNMLMKTDRKKSIIIYGDTYEDRELSQGFNYAEQLGFKDVYATDYGSLK